MKTKKETIKVVANQNNRTFTIRKYVNDDFFAKYRTIKLSIEEFETEQNNTENDWKQFLKSTDYYKVS